MSQLTIRNLDNARLAADAKHKAFLKKFDERIFGPDRELAAKITFNALTPEAREAWSKNDPESFKIAQEKYGG